MLAYQDLITTVAARMGLNTDEARGAAEATIVTLARSLDEPRRRAVLEAVPTSPHRRLDAAPRAALDADAFVGEVSRLTGTAPGWARYQAQAVLAIIAEQKPDLVDSLELPDDIRDMCTDPATGGGITDVPGHTAPLTPEEVATALTELSDWRGDTHAISRSLTLPPESLDRVLARLDLLQQQAGHRADIHRDGDTIVIRLHTEAARAVTTLDLDLALRIDTVITQSGAGIDS